MTTFARDLTSLVFVDFYHKSNEAVVEGSQHAIKKRRLSGASEKFPDTLSAKYEICHSFSTFERVPFNAS